VALGRLADDVFGGLEARQAAGLRSGQSLLSTLCVADGSAERREEAPISVETNLTELTAMIVASFVANNPLAAGGVPALIESTHAALLEIDSVRANPQSGARPAVPIEESIAHDYLICLNDGRKLRALKRYIKRKYSLSPDQYRKKWGLPDDYPMVAPAYSELRANIAKQKD
jgi:predicted transcriptional regulator